MSHRQRNKRRMITTTSLLVNHLLSHEKRRWLSKLARPCPARSRGRHSRRKSGLGCAMCAIGGGGGSGGGYNEEMDMALDGAGEMRGEYGGGGVSLVAVEVLP